MEKKTKISIIVSCVLLIFIFYSYFNQGIIYNILEIDADGLVIFLSKYFFLSMVIYVLLMIFEVVFAPLHPLLFYIAGGIVFGPILAIILSVIGGLIGGTIAFFIARKWGRKFVEKKIPIHKRKKFDEFSKKYGGWAIFLLRLNPLTSTDLWNYVAGLSKVKFAHHIIGTSLGLIPATALMIYFGVPIQNSPLLFKLFLIAIIIYLVLGIILFLGIKKKS